MSQLRLTPVRSALILALAALAACSGSPTKSARSDLSGNWVLTTRSQFGAQDAAMTIVQTGQSLAGTVSSEIGNADLTGTVDGDTVSFHFSLRIHGVDLPIRYAGTIARDSMYGGAAFGPLGNGNFYAKRAAP